MGGPGSAGGAGSGPGSAGVGPLPLTTSDHGQAAANGLSLASMQHAQQQSQLSQHAAAGQQQHGHGHHGQLGHGQIGQHAAAGGNAAMLWAKSQVRNSVFGNGGLSKFEQEAKEVPYWYRLTLNIEHEYRLGTVLVPSFLACPESFQRAVRIKWALNAHW